MRPFPSAMLLGGGVAATSTFNPADKNASLTLSTNNLTVTDAGATNGSAHVVRGTVSRSAGKRYFESKNNVGNYGDDRVGIAKPAASLSAYLGLVAASAAMSSTGEADIGGAAKAGTAFTTGDVVMVAVDLTNGLIYFGVNGTWVSGQSPVAGTGGYSITAGAAYFPAVQTDTPTDKFTLNTGGSAFAYPMPTGFTAWG